MRDNELLVQLVDELPQPHPDEVDEWRYLSPKALQKVMIRPMAVISAEMVCKRILGT